MATRGTRSEKVKRIFQQFDLNNDAGLNRHEMAALVVAVNPRVKFSDEQISAILDEVFRTYADFIDPDKGLTYDGLLRTYDDGAGDVDRDFEALGLELKPYNNNNNNNSNNNIIVNDDANVTNNEVEEGAETTSFGDAKVKLPEPSPVQQRTVRWAASPNHGIVFDDTWKLVDDLEVLIKRLRTKQMKDSKGKAENSDVYSDPGWSRELGPSTEMSKQIVWDESKPDYAVFVKELGGLRSRADGARSREEAFDGHMAIGRVLYDQQLFKEALVCFKRACELQPTDVRPHFRAGNCYYVVGRYNEGKDEFVLALDAAEAGGNQWAYLLPQIHVNLGISLEAEGMVISACEHYREAAILCPTHFRALKLLGSALLGVGEYKAAVKALEEAIYLKNDYADAHCDLASALHAMGNNDNAVKEFQKAIDLKPGHVDALYNLGGLYMDMGRYQRASEVYVRVLGLWPNHWRAQLNKAVSLLGAGETDEAKKSLKEALKMTSRVELHDALSHLKQLQKKKPKGNGNGEDSFMIIEPLKFKTLGEKTSSRQELATALDIRSFQRITRLFRCDVELLKKEMNETDTPLSYSGYGAPQKSIRKPALECILRRLLSFLKAETFVGAVKAINVKILSVLDESESGRVDLGMFFAVLAPICGGAPDKRKRVAFESLLWRPMNEERTGGKIKKADALCYIKLLRSIYIPNHPISEFLEIHGETDASLISLPEFLAMFDDQDWGFGVMSTLLKLESGDRNRHGNHTCSVCRYPIIGSRFKEMKSRFSLCSQCYSEGKVSPSFKQEEYNFKEYANGSEAVKDKCMWFSSSSHNSKSSAGNS
ncbi:putative EF-hand domain, tetratricopeptide-like helical domain superfamily, EF-hand domain pair [Helianthus annuus]|nr:putative EF-hand domain, tetratricopeptide-like helical domain superfamily, EF-hand domain pair [Helianthus annuus]